MAIYTVHEPPANKTGEPRDPERFAFVRDGLYWWALLLTPLWLLYRKLWLAFVVYAVAFAALWFGLQWLGVGRAGVWFAFLALSALVGLEGGTLLRRKLAWWRWNEIGLVSAPKLEIAEQRFFDRWTRGAAVQKNEVPPAAPPLPSAAATVAPPPPRWQRPQDDGVIGLFPQPGTSR